MLAIFHKGFAHPPHELNSPDYTRQSKKPEDILRDFTSSHPSNSFRVTFGTGAALAFARPVGSPAPCLSFHQRY